MLVRKLNKKIWIDREILADLGGMQGDALKNFNTSENALSLYYVDDAVTAKRVAAAIACGRERLDNADFAVFDESVIDELHLEVDRTPGETADTVVNGNHINVINLTATKVARLAGFVHEKGNLGRVTKKQLTSMLKALIRGTDVDRTRISDSVLSVLEAS